MATRPGATVFERFEAIAGAFPNELVYSCGRVTLTYSELAAWAHAARARILSLGTSAPGLVGILTDDRVKALMSILGAAGSGHAYVLLDVNDPDKRIAHIIEEADPFAILADAPLLNRAKGLIAGRRSIIDLDNLIPRDHDAAVPGLPVSPESLLYVSFTSGSTGVPKGVCQTHGNLGFYADAYIDAMAIRARDRISWLFAHGVSASNMDIYGALFTGAQLCALEFEDEFFQAMARWIDDQDIALLHTVPTILRELVGAIEKDRVFEGVRTVDLAGEMLFAHDVVRMRPHFRDDCRIFNRLAATEASFISSLVITKDHEKAQGALPVGKPPKGVEIGIVRADGTPADPGETGTIVIDSPHICAGYIKCPDLNAQIFSDITGKPGWRRYKSADLGFLDQAGDLNFIGRSGSRIKLRGHAVDLAEVETALYECPGVTGAVVLPRGESGGEAREILAYLTLADEAGEDGGEIRKQLAQSVPPYMLPSGYVFLDKFPYTATSKVDRKALAALDLEGVRFRPGYEAPADEVEEKIAMIFSEVLNQPSVGRLDDFFLLGGDSLSLIDLQILAAEVFDQQFPRLHEDATVSGIAERLREAEGGGDRYSPLIVPIRTEGSAPPLFVVHGRRGQAHVGPHFIDLLGSNQPLYALQARGVDGKQEPHSTVEAMAAEYVAAIRTVQPEGPYFIGGFCAGCYIAIEILRQLHDMDEKFFAPLLIDPPLPEFKEQPKNTDGAVFKRMEMRVKSGAWNLDLQNPQAIKTALKVSKAIDAALYAYTYRPFPVRSMIVATTNRWWNAGYVRGVFGKNVHVFLVDGGHREMLSPQNRQFANAVRACIAHIAQVAEDFRQSTKRAHEAAPPRSPAPSDPV